MKRLILFTTALVTLTASAEAADFARRRGLPDLPYDWSGFYIGANLGYGHASATTNVEVGGLTLNDSSNLKGFLGGVQAGINWQSGHLLLGTEGDLQATDLRHNVVASAPGLSANLTDRIPWFATVRGRIGYAHDQWLLYATGGLALSEIKTTGTVTTGGVTTSIGPYEAQPAWTIGAGVETALWSSNWTTKLEYLYIDSLDIQLTTLGITTRSRASNNVIRVGLNYRFGGTR
jgi:outer membrane immunogenic protein